MSSSIDTREYDSFGPWPLEVVDLEGMPRLFRSHPIDFSATRLVLKVPREIERRNATPAMDLYDSLVIAEAERLRVLTREGDSFSVAEVPYRAIAMIENSVNLLDGRLRILSTDGSELRVPFNGSTRILINRLIALLRDEVRGGSPETFVPLAELRPPTRNALGEADVALTAAYQDLARADESLHYFGGYGRRTLVPIARGAVRAAYRLWPAVLHATIVFGARNELHILSRRDRIIRSRTPVMSISETIVELDRVSAVAVEPHPQFEGVDVVTLGLGAAAAPFDVDRGSAVEGALLALGRQ